MPKPASPIWTPSRGPAGCVFYVPFSEGSGPPRDVVGGRVATVVGVPTWGGGPYGWQRGGYATTKYDRFSPLFTSATYPNWVAALYNTSAGTPQQIAGHQYTGGGNPLQSLIINGANAVWQVRDNAGTLIQVTSSGVTANSGTWRVAMGASLANNNHQIYVDGIQFGSSSSSVGATTFDNLSVGASLRNTVSNGYGGVLAVVLAGYGAVPDPWGLYCDLISGRFSGLRSAWTPIGSTTVSLYGLDLWSMWEPLTSGVTLGHADPSAFSEPSATGIGLWAGDSHGVAEPASIEVDLGAADALSLADLGPLATTITIVSIASGDVLAFTDGLKPSAVSASDTFTDTSGTALTSHVPDSGGSWSRHPNSSHATGTISNSNFALVADTTERGIYLHSTVPSSGDYTVQATVQPFGGYLSQDGGIVGWYDPTASSGIACYYSGIDDYYAIDKHVSGVFTNLGVFAASSPYTLKITRSGSSISAYVNGTLAFGPTTVTDIPAIGQAGIYGQGSNTNTGGIKVDSFSYVSLGTYAGPEIVQPLATDTFTVVDRHGLSASASMGESIAMADATALTAYPIGSDAIAWASEAAAVTTSVVVTSIASSDGVSFAERGGDLQGSPASSDLHTVSESPTLAASAAYGDSWLVDALHSTSASVLSSDPIGSTDSAGSVTAALAVASKDLLSFGEAFAASGSLSSSDVASGGEATYLDAVGVPTSAGDVDTISLTEAFALSASVSHLDPLAADEALAIMAEAFGGDVGGTLSESWIVSIPSIEVVDLDPISASDLAGTLEASLRWLDTHAASEALTVGIAVAALDPIRFADLGASYRSVVSTDSWAFADSQAAAPTVYTATLAYHIYGNDGAGGPIDYSSVIATTGTLTWTSPALSYPGTYRYGVRAYSVVSGLEEQNLDAAVDVVLDSSGADVTLRPLAPIGLNATAQSGGKVLVAWKYPGTSATVRPTGFHVYKGTGTPDYGSPAATVAWSNSLARSWTATLTGVADGTHAIGVRAYNGVAEEPNTTTVSVTVDGTAPAAVESLTAVATAEDD